MKFSVKDFFSKCEQIRSKLRNWSHLLKKSLMENFIFCAVIITNLFMNLTMRNFWFQSFKSIFSYQSLYSLYFAEILETVTIVSKNQIYAWRIFWVLIHVGSFIRFVKLYLSQKCFMRSCFVFLFETAWKVSRYGVFPGLYHYVKSVRIGVILVRIFPHSDWMRWDTVVSLCIQSERGKIRTRISPNTDTFHAVHFCVFGLDAEINTDRKELLFWTLFIQYECPIIIKFLWFAEWKYTLRLNTSRLFEMLFSVELYAEYKSRSFLRRFNSM